MRGFELVLGSFGSIACAFVGWFKFGYAGVLLVFATFVAGSIYFSGIYGKRYEDDEPEHNSCSGCKHNLGGGHCRINVEGECREGGGYELYEEDYDGE